MSAHTNPKKLIIDILKNNILVYDDQGVPALITGVVAGTWYDKRVIGDKAWMVSVGPTLNTELKPNDIGANTWWADNVVLIDCWIPVLQDPGYTPERLRFSVKEEVKRLLFLKLVNPVSDVKYLRIIGWQDLDDRENDMLRVQFTVSVEWEQ